MKLVLRNKNVGCNIACLQKEGTNHDSLLGSQHPGGASEVKRCAGCLYFSLLLVMCTDICWEMKHQYFNKIDFCNK